MIIIASLVLAGMTLQSPSVHELLSHVSRDRMRATVEKLASWHTRNTSSPGLTEAAHWIADQYRSIPGIQVELMTYTIEPGPRVPAEKEVVEVIAKLPGEDDRMVLVGGHLDSINMTRDASGKTSDPLTARAPGANDDGSGAALALEMAHVMAPYKWKHTLVFCAFSGEEQGLLGSTAMAARAKQENWKLDAVLSNDMVGNSHNNEGQSDSAHVRLFSENPDETGKNPQNSRELARYIDWITRGQVPGHSVKLVLRRDRFGRGGDHTPFSEQGFDSVRFVDVHEEYSRQHTPNDLPEFVDWDYLANNAKLNLVALAALANAGPAPTKVHMDSRQGYDTTLTWTATPGVRYVVYQRDTASTPWQKEYKVGAVDHVTLPKVSKDDNFFAVGAEGGVPVRATRN